MDITTASRLRDFSCGLFFMFQLLGTLLLYLKGRQHSLQRSAFHYMLYLLGLSVVEFYIFFIHNFLGTLMLPLTNVLQMTVIPLSLLLLYRLTHPTAMPTGWAVAHCLPYVLALAAVALWPEGVVYQAVLVGGVVHIVGIIGYGAVAVRRFHARIRACCSTEEGLSLRWLWQLLALMVVLGGTWMVATLSGTALTAALYNVMCTLILSLLCYFVYRQEDMLDALGDPMSASEAATQVHSATPSPQADFALAMEHAFARDGIYLDAHLNINTLARHLGTNRTYISQYLNQQLHTSFYEYVNHWRLRRALELLSCDALTLDQVAAQSGFNSLTTFRRYFHRQQGCTPSAYRARLTAQREGDGGE